MNDYKRAFWKNLFQLLFKVKVQTIQNGKKLLMPLKNQIFFHKHLALFFNTIIFQQTKLLKKGWNSSEHFSKNKRSATNQFFSLFFCPFAQLFIISNALPFCKHSNWNYRITMTQLIRSQLAATTSNSLIT